MTNDRPELTTLVPADPRLPQLPKGYVCGHLADDGRLWVDHADPRVVIGVQLLEIIEADPVNGVTLTLVAGAGRARGYVGAVLRIEAANRTLVYRITEWLPWYLGCIAEWPD